MASCGKTTLSPGPSSRARANVTLQGRSIPVESGQGALPQSGIHQGQVIDYYARVAKVLLPRLKDRLSSSPKDADPSAHFKACFGVR